MKNPLVAYKIFAGVTWQQIADATGISLIQIHRLATYDNLKMRNITLDTVVKLKKLGIDCITFVTKS